MPESRPQRPKRKKKRYMNTAILNRPGELFLGSDRATAIAQGPRPFRSSAKALSFAMEQAAPVSLRGAMLRIDGQTFERNQIIGLYNQLKQASAQA